jgi:hypothetical protein
VIDVELGGELARRGQAIAVPQSTTPQPAKHPSAEHVGDLEPQIRHASSGVQATATRGGVMSATRRVAARHTAILVRSEHVSCPRKKLE